MPIHGLTFIAVAGGAQAGSRWEAEHRRREASLDRQRRLTLAGADSLTTAERELLASIENQLTAESLPESDRPCPECQRPFVLLGVSGVELDCCRFCRGIWFDPGELQSLSGQEKEIPSDDKTHRASRFCCPVCGTQMNEFVFVNPHTLLVDRCPRGHGVYLQDRELERVFEVS